MPLFHLDLSHPGESFKPFNATNGGPMYRRYMRSMHSSNLEDYTAARIPYARNHDCLVHSVYGGPYSHDITAVFPNFDADPSDPESYDFACTDESILSTLEAGTRTFYRLGQTIENIIKKHATLPPRDFQKWAVICEHIIRHYTEGWADGFQLDMPYWEIWNEPDLDPDDSTNKRCWGGTRAQFFEFYKTVSRHLKACFPHLKIGGPASMSAWGEWGEDFLRYARENDLPLDFFSWHRYATEPEDLMEKAVTIRAMLDKYGYTETENILNEWNYVRGWGDEFVYTLKAIRGAKGATFAMSVMTAAIDAPLDMMMYYDTRPSGFDGAFDPDTKERRKGYYALAWYGMFYDGYRVVRAAEKLPDLYCLAGVNEQGKLLAVLTHYAENDDTLPKEVTLDIGRPGKFEICLVDDAHENVFVPAEDLTFTMKVHSMILIREL